MDEIPLCLGSSGALARRLLQDYRAGRVGQDTVKIWIRNWRAAAQNELADKVADAIGIKRA